MTETKRTWYWAVLLSILQPGLGHMYAGRLARGVAIYAALVVTVLAVFLLKLPAMFQGFLIMLPLLAVLWIAMLADAGWLAGKPEFEPKPYNRWGWYILYLLMGWTAGSVIQGTNYLGTYTLRALRIPSESMASTLVPGDHLYADMAFYSGHEPKADDIVVMSYPENASLTHIKRIVAVPGDEVEFTGDSLTVNGNALDVFRRAPSREVAKGFSTARKLVLGQDQYYVMGDNAAYSQDSRHFGPIGRREILGKALYIYYSPDLSRIGKSL